jgi:large conductance mechanosensitive channel
MTKSSEPKAGQQVTVVDEHGKHHRGVAVLLDTDDALREQAQGFTSFLRDYAVVGLAVGFIVGQQANAVVKQLVTSFFDPLTQMWFGQTLSAQAATIHHDSKPIKLPWGEFVYVLLEFFIVLIVIYLLIKLFKLDKYLKPKESKK